MKSITKISHLYKKSSLVVPLVIITVLSFISLLLFFAFNYSIFLNQLESVLAEEEIESQKMQINSQLMQLARSRTLITSEILDTNDYFKKDELNMQLEIYANKFSILRNELLNYPLKDEEKKILEQNNTIISKILPVQRSAVELAMSDSQEDNSAAKSLLYNLVIPGQNKLIESFSKLVSIEQNNIAKLTATSNHSLKSIKKRNIKITITAIIVAIIFSTFVIFSIRKIQLELRIYSKTLEQINESLEIQVKERTKELSELNSLLKNDSEHDELTGLYNRRKFNSFMNDEYSRTNRLDSLFSLILIDIDYFKPYNDNYGHQQGDQCLFLIANIMKDELPRSVDFIARYGGEEFAVVLPSTDSAGAENVAKNLREAVNKANLAHDYSNVASHVTISQGITTYTANSSKDIAGIIKEADQNLYSAKSLGRNTFVSNPEA